MMVSSRKTKQSRWNSPEAEGDKEKRVFWGDFFGGGFWGVGEGGREVFFFPFRYSCYCVGHRLAGVHLSRAERSR